jgi:methionyl aminopeptidase
MITIRVTSSGFDTVMTVKRLRMLYSEEEIFKIEAAALVASATLRHIKSLIRVGMTPQQVDQEAERFILDNKCLPSFKGYKKFPNATCISVNHVVVHGIPDQRKFKVGDLVSVDVGVLRDGYHGDTAYTFKVGKVLPALANLMKVTLNALQAGVAEVRAGATTGDIGHAIESYIKSERLHGVIALSGHGVGKNIHEEPSVPNCGPAGSGTVLEVGHVIAIEPMVNLGSKDVVLDRDGWTIKTTDKKASAHYEHTVAITKDGPRVLTTFEGL